MTNDSQAEWGLKQLPLPVKLVLTVFLLSVGLGYFWGMAQIHFKHAEPGQPMPGVKELVAHFSGVPWPTVPKPEAPAAKPAEEVKLDKDAKPAGEMVMAVKIRSLINERCAWCHSPDGEKDDAPMHNWEALAEYLKKESSHPVNKMHSAVSGPGVKWSAKDMARAFTDQALDWDDIKGDPKAVEGRKLEKLAMLEWLETGSDKESYDKDSYVLSNEKAFTGLTKTFATEAPKPAGDQPKKAVANVKDPWKEAKQKQLSVESLTQSTHAHLLSFSVLWAFSGLIFAFTSYSKSLRCLIAPTVLVAQVADIACWWLARLEGVGPYFAMAIMVTGGIVGLGLSLQIVLSLLNMYDGRGKLVIVVLMIGGLLTFGVVGLKVVKPQLDSEKELLQQ
ncbi:MAG: hypothetical protein R3B84_06055 [Zavarzinella sp.]